MICWALSNYAGNIRRILPTWLVLLWKPWRKSVRRYGSIRLPVFCLGMA